MKENIFDCNESPVKRLKTLENALIKNPFLYHKKKNVIYSKFNDNNNTNGEYSNQELLFWQDENNKQINIFKNKIKERESLIDNNTHNFLNYIMKEKKLNLINKKINLESGLHNKNIYEINNNNQNRINQFQFPNERYNTSLSNYRNNIIKRKIDNDNNKRKYNSINYKTDMLNVLNFGNKLEHQNSYKNLSNNILRTFEKKNNKNEFLKYDSINNNINKSSFIPRIFKDKTDITDNSYYDKITKQLILQMNKDYMNYNQNIINKKYNHNQNEGNKLRKDELTLPPGYISKPKYYSLGESRLSSNPIVNPGNRIPRFNYYNNINYNHKHKSELI